MDYPKFRYAIRIILVAAISLIAVQPTLAISPAARFQRWGEETLNRIQSEFWLPERNLYANKITIGQPTPNRPAYMWGCGVQLSALTAAAHLDPKPYLPELESYLTGLRAYLTDYNHIPGFDVLPGSKPADRYYDDNEWMVLALIEAYRDTSDARILSWAEQDFKFVMSGEDDKLGGGIYWHEQKRTSKNTCSNAPAIVGALSLYQITDKESYLNTARQLYDWVNAHLQDTDGLYFDHITLSGAVDHTKWSYNSALMIRANCLFYEITHQPSYLQEAERIAKAAEAMWVDPKNGSFTKDGAPFTHLLSEAFLALYRQDKNRRWLKVVRRGLVYLHQHCRDANGNYPSSWSQPVTEPLKTVSLLSIASNARAYWIAAEYR